MAQRAAISVGLNMSGESCQRLHPHVSHLHLDLLLCLFMFMTHQFVRELFKTLNANAIMHTAHQRVALMTMHLISIHKTLWGTRYLGS